MLNNQKWSYWERDHFVHNIDFLIIGAGIVGYSTAIHLKQSNPGAKVIILERGNLPSGASSKNAGFNGKISDKDFVDRAELLFLWKCDIATDVNHEPDQSRKRTSFISV